MEGARADNATDRELLASAVGLAAPRSELSSVGAPRDEWVHPRVNLFKTRRRNRNTALSGDSGTLHGKKGMCRRGGAYDATFANGAHSSTNS